MPGPPNLEGAVRTVVRYEVARVLLPYREALRRLTHLLAVPRARGSPPANARPARRRRRRRASR